MNKVNKAFLGLRSDVYSGMKRDLDEVPWRKTYYEIHPIVHDELAWYVQWLAIAVQWHMCMEENCGD